VEEGTRLQGAALGRGVIEGAFLLLEELTRTGRAGPSRLAEATGLPKATVHRLLDQLVASGAVERSAGHYRMGIGSFRMGQGWAPGPSLRTAAHRPLRELAEAVPGACTLLCVPGAGRSVIVSGCRGEPNELMPMQPGMLVWHGNTVDVLCAPLIPAAAEDVRPPDISGAAWRRRTAIAHDLGVAYDYEPPLEHAFSCVSAPVRAPSGQIIGAVTAVLLDNRRLRSLAPAVKRAANMTSVNLTRLRTTDPSLAGWLDEASPL
jgi:IclR family acetate operon transcriptional repressor